MNEVNQLVAPVLEFRRSPKMQLLTALSSRHPCHRGNACHGTHYEGGELQKAESKRGHLRRQLRRGQKESSADL